MTSASVFEPREMVKVPAIGNARDFDEKVTRHILLLRIMGYSDLDGKVTDRRFDGLIQARMLTNANAKQAARSRRCDRPPDRGGGGGRRASSARCRASGRHAPGAASTPKCARSSKRSGYEPWRSICPASRSIDTAGAWLIDRLMTALAEAGRGDQMRGQSEAAYRCCSTRSATPSEQERRVRSNPARRNHHSRAGDDRPRASMRPRDFMAAMYILGATIRGGQMKLGRGTASPRPRSSTRSTGWASAPFRSSC